MKIIYMTELYPLINPDTIKFSMLEMAQLGAYRAIAKDVLSGYEDVVIWDSHLPVAFEYFKICSRNLNAFESKNVNEFGCGDMWHPPLQMWRRVFLPQLFNFINHD